MRLSPTVTIPIAVRNIAFVITRLPYLLIAAGVAFLFCGLIVWLFNLPLVWHVLTELPLSISQKIQFLWYGYTGLLANSNRTFATLTIMNSLLAGVQTSLLWWILRNRLHKLKTQTGTSGLPLILAIVSGGCAACGGSLLTPLLSALGATSSALISTIGQVLLFISTLLFTYSIYRLGLQIPRQEKHES